MGVEIYFGVIIGVGVFIDYGMGIVIGEIVEIEEDVVLFYGVMLGGIGCDMGKCYLIVKKGVMILVWV